MAVPLDIDPSATAATLKPLHSQAVDLQQQLQAERREMIGAFDDEAQAQEAAIRETAAPIGSMERELAELNDEIDLADAELRELLRNNGVSGWADDELTKRRYSDG
jgi:peptidoglycan hydrolase CwlO-like protein